MAKITTKKKASKTMTKKTSTASEQTEINKLTGVPNSRVEGVVETIKSSPKYVDHVVIADDDQHSTIIATFKK